MIEGDNPNRAALLYKSGMGKLTKGASLTGNANTEYLVNDDVDLDIVVRGKR